MDAPNCPLYASGVAVVSCDQPGVFARVGAGETVTDSGKKLVEKDVIPVTGSSPGLVGNTEVVEGFEVVKTFDVCEGPGGDDSWLLGAGAPDEILTALRARKTSKLVLNIFR